MSQAGTHDNSIELRWTGDLAFEAERAGFRTSIDGDQNGGPSPVGLLIESVAACAAIDVVLILRKGRQDLRGLAVTATAERADSQPRYVTRLAFEFRVAGEVGPAKARRAVQLSFEKYCSVYHSLRPDIELEWSVEMD